MRLPRVSPGLRRGRRLAKQRSHGRLLLPGPIRAWVPHILAGGRGGSVVITDYPAALYANPHTAHYSATKAGLAMLAEIMATELAPEHPGQHDPPHHGGGQL